MMHFRFLRIRCLQKRTEQRNEHLNIVNYKHFVRDCVDRELKCSVSFTAISFYDFSFSESHPSVHHYASFPPSSDVPNINKYNSFSHVDSFYFLRSDEALSMALYEYPWFQAVFYSAFCFDTRNFVAEAIMKSKKCPVIDHSVIEALFRILQGVMRIKAMRKSKISNRRNYSQHFPISKTTV